MYRERLISDVLIKSLNYFPVITITGPRQSGKTTLAKKVLSEFDYVSLEDPDNREFAINDPRGFLKQYPEKTIIDEFQNAPKLVSYLQTHVDAVNKTGMYILTGSNQFQMMEGISQSLAGRTQIIELLPFSYSEIFMDVNPTIEEILFRGSYPRIFENEIPPTEFYSAYFNTYIQKDIRSTLNVKDINLFQSFVKLCAARTGQIVNYSSFANELGIDSKTVKKWMSVLEAGYIVKLVPPYHKNFNKRITKSYKMYFNDVGMASYLLGINNVNQLDFHPLKGELFETYIFSEIQKTIFNKNLKLNIYFLRDNNSKEIDFIIEQGNEIKLIEVKLTSTPSKVNFKNLITMSPLFGENGKNFLIYGSEDSKIMYDTKLIGFREVESIF